MSLHKITISVANAIDWLSGKFNILLPKRLVICFVDRCSKSSPSFLFYKFPTCFILAWESVLRTYCMLLTQLTPDLLISAADPRMPFLRWGAHGTRTLWDLPHTSWGGAGCHLLGLLVRGRVCWLSGSGSASRFSEVFNWRRRCGWHS